MFRLCGSRRFEVAERVRVPVGDAEQLQARPLRRAATLLPVAERRERDAEQGRKLVEAEALIRRAMELDRDFKLKIGDPDADSGNYLDSLGWVLFKRGKFAAAQKALEEATKFAEVSENGVVWDHLGDVYFRTEQLEKATVAYERAGKLFANSHEGRQLGRLDEVKRKLKLVK